MIRTLIAAAALTCATSLTPAFAQTGTPTNTPAAGAQMMSSGYQMSAKDALASKLIGSAIYSAVASNNQGGAGSAADAPMAAHPSATDTSTPASANTAADRTAPAVPAGANAKGADGTVANTASDTNAQKIGTISDLVVGADGRINAVVISVGGVLGIGAKDVAVGYSDLTWQTATDGTVRGMLPTTADALKAAPGFHYPANGNATTVGDNQSNAARSAGNGTATGTTTSSGTTPSPGMTPAPAAPAAGSAMTTGTPAKTNAMSPAPMASMTPQDFANTAAVSNMFEIQSSQLALKQTKNQKLLAFAHRMITDHTKAGQAMQKAATADKVTVPSSLDQASQQKLTRLQGETGQQFDRDYTRMQLQGHQQAVQLFQTFSTSGPNSALKTFAGKTLPTLQSHLKRIQQIAGK